MTKKVNLTLSPNKALLLLQAVSCLDGVNKSAGDKTVFEPFHFTWDFRCRIAANRKKLQDISQAYLQERSNICQKHTGSKDEPKEDHESFPQWKAEIEKLSDQKTDIELNSFSLNELNGDVNTGITPGLISSLSDLIEDGLG